MAEQSVFENLYQEELYVIPPRTLIIVDRPWEVLGDNEQNLLIKILGSVKLSLSSVQIVHRPEAEADELAVFNPSRIISFGVKIRPVQKSYEYVPVDGYHILVADSLAALDDARKKSLWVALRQMFGM
jgi:hypothetical protein